MQVSVESKVLADEIFAGFGEHTKIRVILKDILLISMFAVVMILCAQVAIRLPGTVVPITGQTFGVLLAGGALGARRGALSMLAYSLIGMFLFPVFAPSSGAITDSLGESGVFHFILPWSGNNDFLWNMPSGGYIVGFIVAAFLIGKLAERGWDRKPRILVAMILGNVAIYAFGLSWLMYDLKASVENTLLWGLWPFIPGDALKLVLASMALPGAWALVENIKRAD